MRFSLKTLISLTTLIALVAYWYRPVTIVVPYRLNLPDSLPATVKVSGGLGNPPLTYGGEEWYRDCYRRGWENYLLSFICTPHADWPELDVDVMSDDDYPPLLFARLVGQLGEKAWLDGYHTCRLALREQVKQYGIERVKLELRLDIPQSEMEAWRESLAELEIPLADSAAAQVDPPRSTPGHSPLK